MDIAWPTRRDCDCDRSLGHDALRHLAHDRRVCCSALAVAVAGAGAARLPTARSAQLGSLVVSMVGLLLRVPHWIHAHPQHNDAQRPCVPPAHPPVRALELPP